MSALGGGPVHDRDRRPGRIRVGPGGRRRPSHARTRSPGSAACIRVERLRPWTSRHGGAGPAEGQRRRWWTRGVVMVSVEGANGAWPAAPLLALHLVLGRLWGKGMGNASAHTPDLWSIHGSEEVGCNKLGPGSLMHVSADAGAIIVPAASVLVFDGMCSEQIQTNCYVFVCHKGTHVSVQHWVGRSGPGMAASDDGGW